LQGAEKAKQTLTAPIIYWSELWTVQSAAQRKSASYEQAFGTAAAMVQSAWKTAKSSTEAVIHFPRNSLRN
jgi:hypothetical protein